MKKVTLSLFLSFLSFLTYSQVNSNIVIFSEDEKPFILRLNGVQSNSDPKTNVRVEGIPGTTYKMRIVFADTSLGALNETVDIKPGFEHTYTIKSKKITAFEKKMKKVGNNIAWNFDAKDSVEMAKKRAEIENENSRYVITFLSARSLATANSYSSAGAVSINGNPPSSSSVQNTQVSGSANGSSVQNQSQTQTTTTGNQGNRPRNNNFSLNVNIGGNTQRDPGYVEQTTVTTTTSQPGTVVYVPGYNGPIGCNYPMNQNEFQSAKSSIASKDFEQTKLTLSKQVFDRNCLLSSQVKEIMMLFDFEQTRLDFAKYAYGRTYDIGNYYKVNDAFQFESSVTELNQYIEAQR